MIRHLLGGEAGDNGDSDEENQPLLIEETSSSSSDGIPSYKLTLHIDVIVSIIIYEFYP